MILRRRKIENNAGIGACIEDQLIRQEIAARSAPGQVKPAVNAARLLSAALLCLPAGGATRPDRHFARSWIPVESQTRDQLQRLLKTYDLSGWRWTRRVVIDQGAIPPAIPF